MNKEWKEKWIAALRSGEYVQGKKVLRNGKDEFCCLGVLCDLFVKEGKLEEPVQTMSGHTYEGAIVILPESVALTAGLSSCEGFYESRRRSRNLMYDNDSGKTFLEIADIIEENF